MNNQLEQTLERKIKYLIGRMADMGKRRYVPPRIEILTSEAESYDSKVIYTPHHFTFYINVKTWEGMLPATMLHRIRELIIDAIQLLYYNSRANNPERAMIAYFLRQDRLVK